MFHILKINDCLYKFIQVILRFPTIREGYKCQAKGRHKAFGPETERANRLVRVESLREKRGA